MIGEEERRECRFFRSVAEAKTKDTESLHHSKIAPESRFITLTMSAQALKNATALWIPYATWGGMMIGGIDSTIS